MKVDLRREVKPLLKTKTKKKQKQKQNKTSKQLQQLGRGRRSALAGAWWTR
jgi:hypothetical protein